jgi:hypothetical protein
MAETSPPSPNPKRVAAGRANWPKRKGLTVQGRERLRQEALKNQPWRLSTGPRTSQGKAKVAANGKLRQQGLQSVREIRRDLADLRGLVNEMRELQGIVLDSAGISS